MQGVELAALHCTTGSTLPLPKGFFVVTGARLELSSTDTVNVGRGLTLHQSSAVLVGCSVSGVTEKEKHGCFIKSINSNLELSSCVVDGKNEKCNEFCGLYACDSSLKVQECRVLRNGCLLYTSPSPRDLSTSRMPSSA